MEKTTQQIFGMRLALLRSANGMSQEQVARVLNVSRSTYSYYETGKSAPSLDCLRRLIYLFCPRGADYLLLVRDKDGNSKDPFMFHDGKDEDEPPMPTLSRDERQVLAYFRVLSESQQNEVMQLCSRLSAEPWPKEDLE